jgi:hypothetical protein
MPAPLFGSDAGTTEFGAGKTVDVWASGLAKVTFRNTGPQMWHDRDDVIVSRWVVDKVHDRRENCDGADVEDSIGLDCSSPMKTWSLSPWYASNMAPPLYLSHVGFEVPEETMYRSLCPGDTIANRELCRQKGEKLEGSIVKTKFSETKLWTQGPYDPLDKVVFLNPVDVNPLIFLDAEPNTGVLLRISKPMMASMRLHDSMLFPNVGDVLIPLFVAHEHAESPLSLRRTVRQLQGAVKAEGSTLPMMIGMGSILLITGILQCGWRMVVRKAEKAEKAETAKQGEKDGIVLC